MTEVTRMSAGQRLRQEPVYRLGALLEDLAGELRDVVVEPILFDRERRCFHWLAVDGDNWDPRTFCDYLLKQSDHLLAAAAACLGAGVSVSSLRQLAATEPKKLHDRLLAAYVATPIPHDHYCDGVVYHQLLAGDPMRGTAVKLHADPNFALPLLEIGTRFWAQAPVEDVSDRRSSEGASRAKPAVVLDLLRLWLRLGQRQPAVDFVVPIYEGAQDGENTETGGSLWLLGVLHALIYERDASKQQAILEQTTRVMENQREAFAAAFRQQAFVSAATVKLPEGQGLMQIFLQQIAALQDWETAELTSPGGQRTVFKRVDGVWKARRRGPLVGQPLVKWTVEELVGAGVLDLSPEERESLGLGTTATFYAPGYARVKNQEADRRLLFAQQADLLRVLLPRWRATRAATRMAAVAIAARNLSHNIGSHVLARLSEPGFLGEVTDGKYTIAARKQDEVPGPKEKHLAQRRDLARFNGYLRDRMDFLADLATTTPRWVQTVTLQWLWTEFHMQPVLREWLIALADRDAGEHRYARIEPEPKAVEIALPHGVLGAQALFVIFEGALRNSARHGSRTPARGPLSLHLAIDERSDDVVRVSLEDRHSPVTKDSPSYKKIVRYLKQPLIEKGALSLHGWGIREMKIAAAFLRMQSLSAIDQRAALTPGYPSTLREPFLKVDHAKGYLSWSLLLLRPKVALVSALTPHVSWKRHGYKYLPAGATPTALEASLHPFAIVERRRESEHLPYRQMPLDQTEALTAVDAAGMKRRLKTLLTAPASPVAAAEANKLLWSFWTARLATNAGQKRRLEPMIFDERIASEHLGPGGVIFLRHPRLHQLNGKSLGQVLFLEGYDAQSPSYDLYRQGLDGLETPLAILLETALVAVLLIDERLAVWQARRSKQVTSRRDVAKSPELSFGLGNLATEFKLTYVARLQNAESAQATDLEPGKLWRLATSEGAANPGLIFVTIHENIVRALERSRGWKLETWMKDFRESTAKPATLPRDYVRFSIHSGRGITGSRGARRRVPFVEYSNLEHFVRDTPSKTELCRILFAAR
jgi:hypothetical protein